MEAVFGNQTNIMRMTSFSMRGVLPVADDYTIDGWSCFLVPSIGVDDVVLYNVFKRNELSSLFLTSSTVLFDQWISKVNFSIGKRLSWVLCPRKSTKCTRCTHENIVSKLITDRKLTINTSPPVKIGTTPGTYDWDTVMLTIEHKESNYPVENQDSVSSHLGTLAVSFHAPLKNLQLLEYSGLPLNQEIMMLICSLELRT